MGGLLGLQTAPPLSTQYDFEPLGCMSDPRAVAAAVRALIRAPLGAPPFTFRLSRAALAQPRVESAQARKCFSRHLFGARRRKPFPAIFSRRHRILFPRTSR